MGSDKKPSICLKIPAIQHSQKNIKKFSKNAKKTLAFFKLLC